MMAIAGRMENRTQKATSSRNQATISPAVPRGGILVKVKNPIVRMTASIVMGTICSRILASNVIIVQFLLPKILMTHNRIEWFFQFYP
jgi:hypothetical protein